MCEWRTTARSPTVRPAISGPTDGEEVERPVQVPGTKPEVPGADRGHKAVVEGLRHPECDVNPVPAEPQGDLVGPQLARMDEAKDLDRAEMGREELAVLAGVVFAQVPRVLRLLRAR